ncbi:F-box/kelch-repeat protein At3g06240-like [Silene latifolia]|uniref:F-box/kelch-repeat protein At3g06240-like n=1 Tax=Silene latifolia TaxID=37657 RepID=UPI003D77074B
MKRKTSGCTLPEELVIDILFRLPVKTLVRSRCVCKSWRDLITSRDFVKLHLNCSLERNSGVILLHYSSVPSFLASFDFNHPRRPAVELHYPDMVKLAKKKFDIREIVGICNGIVCFEKAEMLVFYNPATRESIDWRF